MNYNKILIKWKIGSILEYLKKKRFKLIDIINLR